MPEAYKPTEEQQRVIDTTDRTILLSAAAGSGKTATLTKRLIAMITREEDPLDVTRMLVVTFTRAAAEELRSRISSALAEAVLEHPDNDRLSRQLLLLPTARIRTIDAFCNDLVKGHTDALDGVSPLYRIADEAEIDLLGISLFDDLIEEAYNGTFAPEGLDISSVVEIAESVKEQGSLAEQLYKLYKSSLHGIRDGVARLKAHADALDAEVSLPFFQTRAGKALAKHYKDTLRYKRALLCALKDALIEHEGADNVILTTLAPRFAYLTDTCRRLSETIDISYEALCAKAQTFALPGTKRCPPKYDYSPIEALYKKRLTDTATELKKLFATFTWEKESLVYVTERSAAVTRSVYLLLSEFEKRLNGEKRRRATFDYDDITGFAYQLLCREIDDPASDTPDKKRVLPTSLAEELRSSFDTVCIDEYQDVNLLQHRIFEVISTERNRFMVGDIKQSIYAFRGAVPNIFNDLRSSFPALEADADRAVLYLTKNFRSATSIIDFGNAVFDFLFPIIGDSIEYLDMDRLSTLKEENPAIPLPVLSLLVREKKEKSKDTDEDAAASGAEEDADDEEATPDEDEKIAELVLSLLQNGKKGDGSPIRPSDIAILSREYSKELIDTLGRKGIPLKTKDKTDFFSRKEILLALALCHAVNNPHRDIYLGGLLRSPLYGFTLDELIDVRNATKEGSLYTALLAYREAHPESVKTARVLADLARFRAIAENAPSHRLIRTMFDELAVYSVTDASGRAALRAFYELARSYEATAFRGLYRFLHRVGEIRRYGYGLPDKEIGDAEAVTVSTVHASKGLEYPVCILAHTGKSLKKSKRPPFLFSEELGLSFSVPSEDGRALIKTPTVLAHEVARLQGEMEEQLRVLYVALTRPKEQLYIFSSNARKLTETIEREAELLYYSRKKRALEIANSPVPLSAFPTYAVWMLAALKEHPALFTLERILPEVCAEEPTEACTVPETEAADAAPSADEVARELARYRERFSFCYPHAAEASLPAKLSVSKLYPGVLDEIAGRSPFDAPDTVVKGADGGDKEDDYPVPAFIAEASNDDAAKRGTATHLFLQFCKFNRILKTNGCQNGEKTIEEELNRLTKAKFMREEDAALVCKDELARFLSSDLAEEIVKAVKTHREFRFHASLPAEDFALENSEALAGLSLFAQGVIDLLLERADGSLLLVDYKTDRLPRTASDGEAARLLFERHGTQLSVYAKAVAHIFDRTPDVAIYSLPKGKLLAPPKTEKGE